MEEVVCVGCGVLEAERHHDILQSSLPAAGDSETVGM